MNPDEVLGGLPTGVAGGLFGVSARFASRLSANRLRFLMILILAAMTMFMAFRAWQ